MQETKYRPPRTPYKGAVVRRNRKKNTANFYLTMATGVIAALGALLSVNVFFNLDSNSIQINGSNIYPPEQIAAVGGITGGQNLIRMNTDFVDERIRQNLVYVDDVQVVKDYPKGIIINITEAVPKSQIDQDGSLYTVSLSGRLLEVNQSERDPDLPLIKGYELKNPIAGQPAESKDPQKTDILTKIFSELREFDFKGINTIDLSDRTDIKLYYDDRIEIELGSSVDLDIKLKSIKAVVMALPENYQGTLRYNGIDSGISAIPKQIEVPKDISKPDKKDDESSSEEDSSSQQDTVTDYYDYNNGYWDEYGNWVDTSWQNQDWNTTDTWTEYQYDGQYYDGGYGYDYGYDYGAETYYYDENYGY